MRIDLTNYNATPTSTFRIYRSYKPFTEDRCPVPLVELPAGSESYHDRTVELNRVVYYRIGVVHDNSEVIGPMYTEIKKYYTGPQVNQGRSEPDYIVRGDGLVGRYGSIKLDKVYPVDQIPVDFPNLPLIEDIDYSTVVFQKCLYDDKVLFVPSAPLVTGSLEKLYNAGILFANGDGKDRLAPTLYNSITTKVQQGVKVHAGGFTYWCRLLNQDEFLQLYVKLYPTSELGKDQTTIIANNVPHAYASPVLTSLSVDVNNQPLVDLEGNATKATWSTDYPLFLILELVSRSDTAFPDPNVVVKPTLTADRMMMCGGEIVNNRVHYFGGISTTFTTGGQANDRHISFDLNGENEQVHAPMPTGVYKPVTWTHNNKIYSFGGVKKIGSTEWSYQELYNNVQVWEDNNTPEGKWTVLPSNVQYGFDSCGTVYYDDALDKNIILIMGGYNTTQPGIANSYYYADVNTFDGNFESATVSLGNNTGGGAIKAYHGDMIWVSPINAPNGYTNATYRINLPINPPSRFYSYGVTTQGTELPTTKGGKMFTWRDTLFLVTSKSFDGNAPLFYIYQWAPNESRWLRVTMSVPELGNGLRWMGTATFTNNRVYVLASQPWTNENATSVLMVIDLIDPTEADLVPINIVTQQVNRIYPPYAKVVKQ